MSYRKTAVGLIIAFLILALSGCGTAEAKSMNGTWKSPDFVAHIKPNHIDIYVVNDGNAFLYWRGDFVRRDRTFFSKADTKALHNALLGSENKTKMFHLSKNGRLWFQFSAMGMSKIITMRQVHRGA